MFFKQTSYNDTFENTIKEWADIILEKGTSALIHVYIPYNLDEKRNQLKDVRSILASELADVPVIGCSASGQILNGDMNDEALVVTAMIFEDASTNVNIVAYYDKKDSLYLNNFIEYVSNISDLKAIELLTSSTYPRLEAAKEVVDTLPEDIDIFGSVAVGDDEHESFVFANDSDCCTNGSALVFYSGPELHVLTNRMFGWKPIGYPLKVTRAEGDVVYEIDGKPAYDIYQHYLDIKKGPNFFYDALVFPLQVQVDENTKYIRHAKSVNTDGSIVMSSIVPVGSNVYLTYGDPLRIMKHTKQAGLTIRDFSPELVYIINCMGRKLFWGSRENIEIAEMSKYMQTTGFSALGEIMREGKSTLLNNLSIVTIAMREGAPKEAPSLDVEKLEQDSNLPLSARLAIFINTITAELMDTNTQLNEMLYKASHDALTKLLNRGAIERYIYEINDTDEAIENWYLLMFDIDDFKQVNDTYGHSEGDVILKEVSNYILNNVCTLPNVKAGRWGGEEFMILLTNSSDTEATKLAENIRLQIKNTSHSQTDVTISMGVTKYHESENIGDTITRVDALMYNSKENGKDQVSCDF